LSNVQGVTTVVVHARQSVPSAVYHKVSGAEAGCGFSGPGKVHQRRTGSNVDINIRTSPLPTTGACPAAMFQYT
jgi:hypothetical protein